MVMALNIVGIQMIFFNYFREHIRRDIVRIFIIFSENNFKEIFVGKY